MKKYYNYNYFFILIYIFQIGCSEAPQNENFIDYNMLTIIDIYIKIEIEESEDFLPGQLQDLILTEDGTLIVSDWGSRSIVQFGSDGSFKRKIAEQGPGPGELNTLFTLIDSKRDTLLVKYFGMSGQIDVYIQDEIENNYFYDHSLFKRIENNKFINVIEPAPGFGYFAKIENVTQNNRREELFNPPAYSSESLGVVNTAHEIVIDSIHSLQTPNPIFVEAEGGAVSPLGAPPFLSQDHIKYIENGMYLIAKTGDGVIQIFDQNHHIHNEIVLDIQDRSVSESDLNYELKNVPEQFQDKLRERTPGIKPAFIDVWASKELFLLHTDNHEQGKEMVLITRKGTPLGKFYLSEHDEIHYLKKQNIYTLHKDQESGHSIRVYELVLQEN